MESHLIPEIATSDDERLARDMQLALDLQAKEERRAARRLQRGEREDSALEDGFNKDALNADHMLFVSCTIDRRGEVDMLVDTGASTSAMSIGMVKRLGLEAKLNSSIYGSAKGVGSSNILGIVENLSCTIGHVEFRLFFMVLEGKLNTATEWFPDGQ